LKNVIGVLEFDDGHECQDVRELEEPINNYLNFVPRLLLSLYLPKGIAILYAIEQV